jgi:hypothetical protein
MYYGRIFSQRKKSFDLVFQQEIYIINIYA